MDRLCSEFLELIEIIKQEKPQKSDAIIWLQGDRYDRAGKVLNLFREGWAKRVVITGNDKLIGLSERPGEKNISLGEMAAYLKKKGIKDKFILIDNKSYNTADQAENVLQLAIFNKWKKIILVASLYHQVRVYLTFLKKKEKLGWEGRLVNQPSNFDFEKKPSGRAEKSLELIPVEIMKIKKYKSDVVDFSEGIASFKLKKICKKK